MPNCRESGDGIIVIPLVVKERFNKHIHDIGVHNAIPLINVFQKQDIDFVWEALYKVIRMDVSKISNIEKILISRLV